MINQENNMRVLTACGINHKTAPLSLREQIAYNQQSTPDALQGLLALDDVNEAVILSTCNRTELYFDGARPELMLDWLAQQHRVDQATLSSCVYFHHDEAAIKHLMRVTSGLDSMVLGESEIVAQVKAAFELASHTGAAGKRFQHLFQTALSVSKQVRTDTGLGASPLSLAYIVVDLASHVFTDIANHSALLIGAGEMVELTATHLLAQGVKRLIIANRTIEKAQQLAEKVGGHAIDMNEISVYLREADMVFSGTSCPFTILSKDLINRAMTLRQQRKMLLVDLAVPRDIEAETAAIEQIELYNIDDLQSIVEQNLNSRQQAAKQAEHFIDMQVSHYMHELRSLNATDTITDFRHKLESMRDEEVTVALQQLQNGKAANQVLSELARKLTNKIMHLPTKKLHQSGYDGRVQQLKLIRQLFEL